MEAGSFPRRPCNSSDHGQPFRTERPLSPRNSRPLPAIKDAHTGMSDAQLDFLDALATDRPCPSDATPPADGGVADSGLPPILLARSDPACNMHRSYSLEFATSLFGEWGVVRHWGRIGTSGRSRTDWYDDAQEAEAAFQDLLQAKRKRGYASR